MGRIDLGRLVGAGLIIGALTSIGYALVMAWLLLWPWKGALAAIGRPPLWFFEIFVLVVLGLVHGLCTAFIHAGFVAQFGAGWRAAVIASITAWVAGPATVFSFCVVLGMPAEVMAGTAALGLVIGLVATVLGTRVYRDRA